MLTVDRLGTHQKYNELLLEAISIIKFNGIQNWKFYFVGPMTEQFKKYADYYINQNQHLKDNLIFYRCYN